MVYESNSILKMDNPLVVVITKKNPAETNELFLLRIAKILVNIALSVALLKCLQNSKSMVHRSHLLQNQPQHLHLNQKPKNRNHKSGKYVIQFSNQRRVFGKKSWLMMTET